MSRPERRRYGLGSYTVELRDRGWYFGAPYEAASAYHGPYSSTASVTMVIARHLRRELDRRHAAFLATVQPDRPEASAGHSESIQGPPSGA